MISFSQKEIKELERKTGLRITDKDSLKAAILHNPAVAVWYRKDAEAYVSIQELRTLVDAAFGKAENLPEARLRSWRTSTASPTRKTAVPSTLIFRKSR